MCRILLFLEGRGTIGENSFTINVKSSIFKQWGGSLPEERNGIVLYISKVLSKYSLYFNNRSLLSNNKPWALGNVTSGHLMHYVLLESGRSLLGKQA